jgi:SPP1 gp7 family putative phage head morphogenesis protein
MTTLAAGLQNCLPDLLAQVRDESGRVSYGKLETQLRASGYRAAAKPVQVRVGKFDMTNPAAKDYIADHTGELITQITETTCEAIRDLVQAAFESGSDTTVDDLADQISDEIGDDDRALMIARTETMDASNEGQQEAWDQAVDDGLLTGDEQQEWIATGDQKCCDSCDSMDGQTVDLGEDFEDNDGETYDGPPAHPNCRCTVGLVLP